MTEQQNTRPSASREIAVKPLKWGRAEADGMNLQADCAFGRYYIALRANEGWFWWRPASSPAHQGWEKGEDEAKAAAQADYERRILSALDTTPGNTDDELRKVQGGWRGVPISTFERLPEKPGKRSYEHVRCLIFIKGEWEVGMWNCEHLVWDDDEGDDFRYHPTEPTHWMPLPSAPTEHPTEQPSVEEAARVLLANTPNPIFDDLKGVMMGELYWTREISDENGDEATEKLYVPWTTIKEIILAALRSLAQEGE